MDRTAPSRSPESPCPRPPVPDGSETVSGRSPEASSRRLRTPRFRLTAVLALSLLALSVPAVAAAGPGADRQEEPPTPEEKLAEMGIELGEPSPPVANYVKAVRTGNLVFLAGHGPAGELDDSVTGKVGRDLTVEQGYEAARRTAISLLTSLKAEIGELSRVVRVVRVFGMVNAVEGFTRQPAVINGCSDLLVELFGDAGRHARAAVGMASLPMDIAVEIEMVVEVEPE